MYYYLLLFIVLLPEIFDLLEQGRKNELSNFSRQICFIFYTLFIQVLPHNTCRFLAKLPCVCRLICRFRLTPRPSAATGGRQPRGALRASGAAQPERGGASPLEGAVPPHGRPGGRRRPGGPHQGTTHLPGTGYSYSRWPAGGSDTPRGGHSLLIHVSDPKLWPIDLRVQFDIFSTLHDICFKGKNKRVLTDIRNRSSLSCC